MPEPSWTLSPKADTAPSQLSRKQIIMSMITLLKASIVSGYGSSVPSPEEVQIMHTAWSSVLKNIPDAALMPAFDTAREMHDRHKPFDVGEIVDAYRYILSQQSQVVTNVKALMPRPASEGYVCKYCWDTGYVRLGVTCKFAKNKPLGLGVVANGCRCEQTPYPQRKSLDLGNYQLYNGNILALQGVWIPTDSALAYRCKCAACVNR